MHPFYPKDDMGNSVDQSLNSETRLRSFVLRFISNEAASHDAQPITEWYGIIRHVQSDDERHFTRWEEAAEFIAQYVDLHQPPNPTQS